MGERHCDSSEGVTAASLPKPPGLRVNYPARRAVRYEHIVDARLCDALQFALVGIVDDIVRRGYRPRLRRLKHEQVMERERGHIEIERKVSILARMSRVIQIPKSCILVTSKSCDQPFWYRNRATFRPMTFAF